MVQGKRHPWREAIIARCLWADPNVGEGGPLGGYAATILEVLTDASSLSERTLKWADSRNDLRDGHTIALRSLKIDEAVPTAQLEIHNAFVTALQSRSAEIVARERAREALGLLLVRAVQRKKSGDLYLVQAHHGLHADHAGGSH